MLSKNSEKLKTFLKKEMWLFILRYGVVGWGISTAILWSTIMHYLKIIPFFDSIFVALLLFPLGGFFLGLCLCLLGVAALLIHRWIGIAQ
jgi:hypothetical protein